MVSGEQQARAERLRKLHGSGILVLPNAWDAASAVLIADAGAQAIATTSAGVSWALGRPDGEGLTRSEMAEAVRRIAAAVDLPVSADVEGGYGPAPSDVAGTVVAVVEAGAAGINLEDLRASGGPLFTIAEQAERIAAARAAAREAGLPGLVVNARTDVHLFGVGPEEGRYAETVARARAYAEAGADSFFVPGLLDLDVLARLVQDVPLPVNAMAGPGAPDVAALAAAGVRRVSVGDAVSLAAYSVARRAAAELLATGGYATLEGARSYTDMQDIFRAR